MAFPRNRRSGCRSLHHAHPDRTGRTGSRSGDDQETLERYPPDKSIGDKDIYGVSLLYHRAGHLFAAEGRQADALRPSAARRSLPIAWETP